MQARLLRACIPAFCAGLAISLGAAGALAQPGSDLSLEEWSQRLWLAADTGRIQEFDSLLASPPDAADTQLVDSARLYLDGLARREAERAEQIAKARDELAAKLAEPETDRMLSDALVSAVTLVTISPDADRRAVLSESMIAGAARRAADAAHAAEVRGDWLTANELFYRLNLLYDEEGTYKADADRLNRRLALIQLYAPERLWELRNQQRLAEGQSELPAYNSAADDYHDKLRGVELSTIRQALREAVEQNVDGVGLKPMILGGIDAVRTLVTTTDLRGTFPGLANEATRAQFLSRLDQEHARVRGMPEGAVNLGDAVQVAMNLEDWNRALLSLPNEAVLHEFASGAMEQLDEFSQIIWPDEVRHFERTTQGNFTGVGIHIQMDEDRNIKVLTPLEGTPAHRAGIRPNDIIRSVNGVSTLGMGINQAVDLITGASGTQVTLGVEREIKIDGQEPRKEELQFTLTRGRILVRTVKGWERTGAGEGEWNWFIDGDRGIAYVRLIQFTDTTSRELSTAISQMQAQGLRGLILDLRFNPGGLLNEAVNVSDLFLNAGKIVSTRNRFGEIDGIRSARPGSPLGDIPVVVLINQGSASASEIVSGALQDYASMDGRNRLNALILGERSFGKGSVQRVWPLAGDMAAMKLTTEYYLLPSGRAIHRRPGDLVWGVQPDMEVDMLPSQVADALDIRQRADVIPTTEMQWEVPDPDTLITEGRDLQLHAALIVLQSRTSPSSPLQTTSRTP